MLLLYRNLIFCNIPKGHNYDKILAGNGLTLPNCQKSLLKIRGNLSGYCSVVKCDFIPTWTWIYLDVTEPCSEIMLLMLFRATTHLMILILVPHLLSLSSCTDICIRRFCVKIFQIIYCTSMFWYFLVLTFMYGTYFMRVL